MCKGSHYQLPLLLLLLLQVVNSVVGPERLAKMDLILAGDDVKLKKPDPMIYNLARERLGLDADKCIVIEDSMVGAACGL